MVLMTHLSTHFPQNFYSTTYKMPTGNKTKISSDQQAVIELDLRFFDETVRLRCPTENKEKLLRATQILNEKFNHDFKNNDNKYQIVLMACLKYAFHEEIKKEIIKSAIEELKQMKKRLSEYSSPIKSPRDENRPDRAQTPERDALKQTQTEKKVQPSPTSEQPTYRVPNNIDEKKYGRFIPFSDEAQ